MASKIEVIMKGKGLVVYNNNTARTEELTIKYTSHFVIITEREHGTMVDKAIPNHDISGIKVFN